MTALEEMEIGLENKHYKEYRDDLERSVQNGKSDYFDQIRYAMTIGYQAQQEDASYKLMFTGGLGVLGNLIHHFGTKIISYWRGTRDLDIVLQEKGYAHLIENSFDTLDFKGSSTSIKNKLCFRGYSHDVDGRRVGATAVDTYIPEKSSKHGIQIEHVTIPVEEWEHDYARISDFYGIPLRILPPLVLLDMKLGINRAHNSHQLPRIQDLEDITSLLGILEREEVGPDKLRAYLSPQQIRKLKTSLDTIHGEDYPSFLERAIVTSTGLYRGLLLK